MAEELKTQEGAEGAPETGTEEEEFNQFEVFDKAPDYAKGGHADEEEINPEEFEQKPVESDSVETKAEPFSKISFNGNNYDFASKEQLEAMAQQGLQLRQQADRLRSYNAIVDAAEKNPALGNAIGQLVQQYMQTGQVIPLQVPQAQTAEDYTKEPEQGDDEDYDDYEQRLAKWRDAKINHLVEQRVGQMFQQQQAYAQQQRITNWSRQVTDACQSDPDKADVLARIMNDNYCAPQLRQLADTDANMFMRVYDDIRRGMGKPPFYGAPTLMPQAQQQPVVPQRNTQQRTAPFSERANNGAPVAKSGSPRQELPDFKKMSDDEFERFKDSLQFGSFN